jgi:1-deoxy-D-xylulose-5-phosphate synthase
VPLGIKYPSDLKGLDSARLEEVAAAVRAKMIEVVTRNGGHLASSLGAVELIVALHHVLNAPADKIVFDVGHQAYAHKMLTGREDDFDSLRLEGGLSGFPRLSESPYDAFGSGHSSTSISAALGLAAARDLAGLKHKVAAVIGDGALTGGMAMEALNNAGALQTDLLVIYNDNRMSISPNVGALSQYLSLKLTTREHVHLRERVKTILERLMPHKGDRLIRRFQRAEEALKGFLISPTAFLAAWGFKYIGPIDGHDMRRLVEALRQVADLKRPVLLHVLTTKGKGFEPAESDPLSFHGVSRIDKAEREGGSIEPYGQPKAKATYTSVFGRYMVDKAKRDHKLVAVTAAMSIGTGLDEFFALYPDRAFDVGIAEQHAVTMAAGLAAAGYRPVVAIYSTFLQRAYDQLFHDVALQNLPVVLAVDRAGLVGEDGPTHHGGLDLAFLRTLPGMTVMAPKDEHELIAMLDKALSLPGPSAVRYPRGAVTGRPATPSAPLEIGKGELLRRGADLAIAAIGQTVWPAFEAAERLATVGINASVLNMRFVKPLDTALIAEAAEKCQKILTAEENCLAGGLFGAVAEAVTGLAKPVPVRALGLGDQNVLHASVQRQRAILGLDADGMERAALEFLAAYPPARLAGQRLSSAAAAWREL